MMKIETDLKKLLLMVFASLFLSFVGLVLISCTLLESINSIFTDKSINPVIDFIRIFIDCDRAGWGDYVEALYATWHEEDR